MSSTDSTTVFSLEEIAKHNSEESCWIILNDSVLDVTNFLNEVELDYNKHPGGSKAILEHAGGDATKFFEEVGHSEQARIIAASHQIGLISKKNSTYFNKFKIGIALSSFGMVICAAAVVFLMRRR